MRTVPIEFFHRMISPYAEACPEFVMNMAVIDTVNDLCRRTGCVVSEARFVCVPKKRTYAFELPVGLKAESVKRLYVGGNRTRVSNADELERFYPEDFTKVEGCPRYFFFRKPYEVELIPVPDKPYGCRMDITVSVSPDTTSIPEVFYSEYSDAVAYGALARILSQTGQTYSNKTSADRYRLLYARELTAIKSEAAAGFQRTSGTVVFNRIV